MSNYGTVSVSAGYALGAKASVKHNYPRTKRKTKTPMKLSLKQRFRHWLMSDESDNVNEAYDTPIAIEPDRLQSEGMRFQVYKGSGGFIIETRSYDRKRDENRSSLYVVTEDKDLGAELGKIITMESLK